MAHYSPKDDSASVPARRQRKFPLRGQTIYDGRANGTELSRPPAATHFTRAFPTLVASDLAPLVLGSAAVSCYAAFPLASARSSLVHNVRRFDVVHPLSWTDSTFPLVDVQL